MNKQISKWLVRIALISLVIGAYYSVPGLKPEVDQAAGLLAAVDIKGMKQYLAGFGLWGPLVSMGLMVLQALAAPLPAFVITFANAWIWGWLWGAVISWTGAMLGAVVCFYLARWFGRPLVERLVGKHALAMSDRFFARYGKHAVLIARLIPIISFDLISYAGGLTNMGLWQFFWTTGLGQLPATIVYSILGENITSGAKYGLMVFSGVAVLLILSLVIKQRMETSLLREGEADAS